MARRNFVAWRYASDDGNVYVRRVDSRMTAQQGDNAPDIALGGSSAAGLSPYAEMPRNIKPRVVLGKEAGVDYRATAVVYTPAAMAAIVTGTTTFVSYDAGGTAHTCVVLGKRGEAPHGTIGA